MTTNSQESGSLSITDAMNALDSLPEDGQQESDAQEAEELTEANPEESDEEVQASDEDDSEESDSEDDEDEQVEEPQAERFTIKVDGKDVEVTRDELVNGYQRTQDYTRKTQALAEQRKAFEAEAQALAVERQQYAQVLQQLSQQIQSQMGQEPDWDALRAQDPIEYSLQWAEWQRKGQRLQAAQVEQARVAQLQQAEQQKQLQAHLAREREALEALIPEIKDQKKAAQVKTLIMEQGKKMGFSEAELAQAYDHRAILALHKAALYDQMMERAKAAKPAASRTVEPGRTAEPASQRNKLRQSFAKTGTKADAARLIANLL